MPRPVRPWFRFYVEAIHDRKLRRLTPSQRWLWVVVLAAARQSPIPGFLMVSERQAMDAVDLADLADMPVAHVTKALPLFEMAGMIARDRDLGCWSVVNWAERQYESDTSTERARRSRLTKQQGSNVATRSLQQGSDVLATPPEAETETDTESSAARAFVEQVLEAAAKRVVETTKDVRSPGGLHASSKKRLRSEWSQHITDHVGLLGVDDLVAQMVPPPTPTKPALLAPYHRPFTEEAS